MIVSRYTEYLERSYKGLQEQDAHFHLVNTNDFVSVRLKSFELRRDPKWNNLEDAKDLLSV